jgi:hypothetical protein
MLCVCEGKNEQMEIQLGMYHCPAGLWSAVDCILVDFLPKEEAINTACHTIMLCKFS